MGRPIQRLIIAGWRWRSQRLACLLKGSAVKEHTMLKRIGLMGLLVLGACGSDPAASERQDDAGGTGGAALAGDSGPGGSAGPDAGAGDAGIKSDAGGATGGTGGSAPTGTGGAIGTGGSQGSGGAAATGGAGGTTAIAECVDPMGWKIQGGLNCEKTKGGRLCATNCTSVRPGGAAGNYIGPPMHPECWSGDFVCVASCSECQ